MNRFLAGAALGLLLCAGSALAQQGVIEATTSSGEKVRLLPDGRWEFVDGQKAAVQKAERQVEAKKQEEVRQAEIKRERGAQGGGVLGIGRTVYEGDKDYNRGTLNPKIR
jgi:hypothetical protein